jgi:predicted metalloprotease with PDZ domain
MLEDEIIAVNGYSCQGELDKWLNYFNNDIKVITVQRAGRLVEAKLPEVDRNFFMDYKIVPLKKLTKAQQNTFDSWRK